MLCKYEFEWTLQYAKIVFISLFFHHQNYHNDQNTNMMIFLIHTK
jgi:hypothetical protein